MCLPHLTRSLETCEPAVQLSVVICGLEDSVRVTKKSILGHIFLSLSPVLVGYEDPMSYLPPQPQFLCPLDRIIPLLWLCC